MKKPILHMIIALVSAVLLYLPSIASAQTCSSPIAIASWPPWLRVQTIQEALDNYELYPEEDHYELCFVMSNLHISSSFFEMPIFVKTNMEEQKDLYVVGLKFHNNSVDPVEIPMIVAHNRGTGKLILKDIQLTDVRNGIGVIGRPGTEIIDSTIQGDNSKSDVCIEIAAYETVVKSSEISGCGEGIRIMANDVLIGAEDHDNASTDMNDIHNNGIGIHVLNGRYNKFGYNSIYSNWMPPDLKGKSRNGIKIERGANENLIPLELVSEDSYMVCEKNGDGIVTKRSIAFYAPQEEGIITVYDSDHCRQPKRYLTSCLYYDEDGLCDITNLPSDVLALIPPTRCRIDSFALGAMFTGTSSTEFMRMPGNLSGPSVINTTPYDIPTTGEETDSDVDTSGEDGVGEGIGSEGGAIEGQDSVASSGGCAASFISGSLNSPANSLNALWCLLIPGFALIAGVKRSS